MPIEPNNPVFAEAYRHGRAQVMWASLISDTETPISLYLKLAQGLPYSFLLESVVGGNRKDRYSFVGLAPDLIWKCRGDHASLNRTAQAAPDNFTKEPGKPFDSLRALLKESAIVPPPGFPDIPNNAGLFGFLGYDMVRQIETVPDTKPDTLNLDDALLMRPSIIAVFDAIDNRITLVTPVYVTPTQTAEAAYAAGAARLKMAMAKVGAAQHQESAPLSSPLPHPGSAAVEEPHSNTSRDQFYRMVDKARDYIAAGDAFQVVLSQRFAVPFPLPAFALYRALRRLNPSPFLFFLDLGGFQLVGSSPEILVRLRDNVVSIRPIAGTRPRGSIANRSDKELAADLLADPKERAEHLMLLDLGRNDVGRVAKIGSVRVTEQYGIEYYSHVMHIVSHVEGELDARYDALDALFAGFPAGTVSGAPKRRAMEIIDELEVARRGVYGGCVGYFGANGSLDTCITLRTAVVKDGMMFVQAGGGVVADSDPAYEYNECHAKARALIRAAEEALRVASKD